VFISQNELAAVSAAGKVAGRKQHGQFNHVQSFPRKVSKLSGKARKDKNGKVVERKIPRQWTVSEIAKEAYRDDDNCRHVKNPLAPILVKGAPVTELERLCDEVMAYAKQADEKRAVRSDVHVLLGAVYSLPYRPDDYVEYRERCDAFIADALAWHEKTYGRVVSAVMHLDENMVHWHVYTLDPDARNKIPGWKAKREEIKRQEALGVSKKEAIRQGNFAYKEAMRKLQDEFFIEVGERNGLARYGDRRMRYQPGEAHLKRAEREAHADALRKAREEEEITRKKIEEERIETTRKNMQTAVDAFEAEQERRRAEHQAEFVRREKARIKAEVANLLETPEYKKEMLLKEQAERIEKMKLVNQNLREELAEKNFLIDRLNEKVDALKKRLREMRNTMRSVISMVRNKFSGAGGKKNEYKR
jgi:hypothetical protein